MPIFNVPKYPCDPTTGVFHPRQNSYGTNRRGEPVPCAIPSGVIADNRRSKCPPFTANQRLSNSQHTKCSINERIDATSWKHLTIGVFIHNNLELGKHVRAELYRLYEMQTFTAHKALNNFLLIRRAHGHTYAHIHPSNGG